MGRYLGVDFGTKTTGLALTDPTKTIVSPFETILRDKAGKLRPTLRRIEEIVAEKDVELIVIGLPLNMDDSKGERALRSEEFAALLKARLEAVGANVGVIMWDERLSTAEADEILENSLIKSHERKQYIDKIAAALILEDYMKTA